MDPDCDGQTGYNTFYENTGTCEFQHETICDDGFDNDMDMAIDCADPDCQSSDPRCGVEVCDDGFDNDGDYAIDCEDTDCFTNLACCGDGKCRYGERCYNDSKTDR